MTARLLPLGFDAGGGWEASLPYLTAVGRLGSLPSIFDGCGEGHCLGYFGDWRVQVNTFCGSMQVFGVENGGICRRTYDLALLLRLTRGDAHGVRLLLSLTWGQSGLDIAWAQAGKPAFHSLTVGEMKKRLAAGVGRDTGVQAFGYVGIWFHRCHRFRRCHRCQRE